MPWLSYLQLLLLLAIVLNRRVTESGNNAQNVPTQLSWKVWKLEASGTLTAEEMQHLVKDFIRL